MKLVCISNAGWTALTLDKIYYIFEEPGFYPCALGPEYYHIRDDFNHPGIYPAQLFKTVEEVRYTKINDILEG